MKIWALIKAHRGKILLILVLATLLPLVIIFVSYTSIEPYKKYIVSQSTVPENTRVGIVLGAGIAASGEPYDELKARLDAAAYAVQKNVVDTLILSGDNRYIDYNEPQAMKEYLVTTHNIPEKKLVLDHAGRSTYESCERAAKIFNVDAVVIFSAGSHLPRAIYLCRSFGIQATGIESGIEANNSTRRELLARTKALFNVWVKGESTILGDPIPLN